MIANLSSGMSDSYTNAALAGLVRSEREKRNWTQEHLAEIAGVSTRTIQRIEISGAHSAETLRSVAAAFDVDCQDLLDRAKKTGTAKRASEDPYLVVHLGRCRNGKDLFDRMGCHGHHTDYPADLNREQAEAVGALLDYFKDFGEIKNDLPISDQIRAQQEMTTLINQIDEMGLAVFIGTYRQKVRVGNGSPFSWDIAVLTVIPSSDRRIVASRAGDTLPVLIPKNQRFSP
jgi:transcriptional regulator with XRE-family HTH domain